MLGAVFFMVEGLGKGCVRNGVGGEGGDCSPAGAVFEDSVAGRTGEGGMGRELLGELFKTGDARADE